MRNRLQIFVERPVRAIFSKLRCSVGRRLVNLRRMSTPASQTNHLRLSLIDYSGFCDSLPQEFVSPSFHTTLLCMSPISTDSQSCGDGDSSAPGKTSAAAGFKDRTCHFHLQLTPKAGWALVYLCLRRDQLLPTFKLLIFLQLECYQILAEHTQTWVHPEPSHLSFLVP